MKVNGIVLAAGFGKRLMPLTGSVPKPLLPVCGKPMLEIALDAVASAGARKIAVNACHLAERIENFIAGSRFASQVEIFRETEILGTGGPLVNAKKILADCDCFLLHNGDILSDFDLKALLKTHLESGAVATMAALDGPENRLLVESGRVVDILGKLGKKPSSEARSLTYAGIAAFSPKILENLPETPVFCSLIDAILKAIAARPDAVACFAPEKPFWSDIGSFEQYFKAHEELLLKRGRGPFHFEKGCKTAKDAKLAGFVSASENCEIGAGARVSSCILLPGAKIAAGERRRNEVVLPGLSVHRDQASLATLKALAQLKPGWRASSLVEQGSDRRFYRISEADGATKALMVSSEKDADFQRFLEIGAFMERNKLGTPALFAAEPSEWTVLMEDLGDVTLYEAFMESRDARSREKLYLQTIEAMTEFQLRGTDALESQGVQIRLFDLPYLRWETAYFTENFLQGLCRLKLDEKRSTALSAELDALAQDAFALPRTLMHRDFQSQNIMLKDGRVRFVDFQGARLGPFLYDAASLIKDPYVNLPFELREKLRVRHCELLAASKRFKGLSLEKYREGFATASFQRNMQALGAYGFLSLKKRKLRYLDYARPCLDFLLEGLAETPAERLPLLKSLCKEAGEALSSGLESAKANAGAA